MAETILSLALNQLSTTLLEEGNLLGGLKQEVEHIIDELEHMRAFLKVAEAKEDDDHAIQAWMKQVREVTYDIEDVLDEFAVLTAHHHASRFSRCFNSIKNLQARHKIAGEIQRIKSRLGNISELRQRYRLDHGTHQHFLGSATIANTWWDDAILVGKERLVGIQKPKQELISQLLDGDSNLKVISVLGMQGLGKTTLVKKVHEDGDVQKQFQITAWITVSQTRTRSIKELLQDLIRQIVDQIKRPINYAVESITELKSSVTKLLLGKRYGIVFEDVCDMGIWNSIKSALPDSGNGSRVMITTQLPHVAQASSPESQGYVYEMKPLSFEDSWTLFCDKTFQQSYCPMHLKAIVHDILSKCRGLPLAIAAIGGVLASKDKDKDKADQWEIVRDSLAGEEEKTGEQDMVKKILLLSYKDLPSHLKTCLLYISIFPEDYEIQCHRLIQLWIAERFVQDRGGMTAEEVAFDYLKELIRRSLVRVTEVSWDGSPDHCRIHDLMREFILRKSQEQNMITLASLQHTRGPSEKVHRLVINNSLTQRSNYLKHLRSLITLTNTEPTLLSELLLSKLLKLLDLRDVQLEEIPNEVFKLFHLRFLCLRGTRVKKVPKSIKKLKNLEHLHLGQTNVRELPIQVLKLKKLRHLRVFQVVDSSDANYECYGFKAPSKIGELLSLHTLLFIDAQNDEKTVVEEIGKLIQLRELGITKLRRQDGEELCSSLQKLINLRELNVTAITKDEVIDIDHALPSSSLQFLRGLILRARLEKLPRWINSLQSLMKIDLIWSRLRGDEPLEFLQHLPSLVEVRLSQAYEGEELNFRAGAFLKLETLYLGDMQGLKWIIVGNGAMPHLQRLYMSELPQLEELPWGIQHLRKLQSLHLDDVSSKLTEKLKNPDDETGVRGNIAHIREVVIGFRADGEWNELRL
ncbi:disease resistance protein RPM1-like [Coffea eugenioides]|uniref:disease resistance protein RPM1-like n=1 Tax=Coffea eugenioides TaxID=49369 RepID=UPI000F60BEA5|nr:disease resistance protein RPM1-like [Coffea eugenioides]